MRICNHDMLSSATTLRPILRPLREVKEAREKNLPNHTCDVCKGEFGIYIEPF